MELTVIEDSLIKDAEIAIHTYENHTQFVLTLDTVDTMKNVSLELSKLAKSLDAKRQEYVRPALDEQKRINGIFKTPIEKLDDLSKKIINRVNDFLRAEQKKESDRLAAIAKENAEKILSNKPIEKEIIPSIVIPKISESLYWDYEVIDLKKVPDEYMCLDNVKVVEAIRSGKRQIPGLQILQKSRAVRR